MGNSKYLGGLTQEQRKALEKRLHDRQSTRCFICDEVIDLLLHEGQLEIDHIDPLIEDGLDAENNFALTHLSKRGGGSGFYELTILAFVDKRLPRCE